MRAVVVTPFYPLPACPNAPPFVKQMTDELVALCPTRVVVPLPWPTRAPRRSQQSTEPSSGAVSVTRYLRVPRLDRHAQGFLCLASLLPALRRLRQEFAFDVVLGTWAYPHAFAAALAAKRLGVPIVVRLHGSDVNDFGADWDILRRAMIRWALRRAQRVVGVSPALKAQVERYFGVPPDKVVVVPNGVDGHRFRPEDRAEARAWLGLATQGKVVLFVGNLVSVKDPKCLLDAFAHLGRRSQLRLCLVGSGPEEAALRRHAARLGLNGVVHWAGRQPHDVIPRWMNAADVLCLPSRAEGSPNVIREALACGTPVVASAVGGVPEIITAPEYGLLVPPDRPEALAVAIKRALSSTWDRGRLAAAGAAVSWRASAALMVDVLDEAVAEWERER